MYDFTLSIGWFTNVGRRGGDGSDCSTECPDCKDDEKVADNPNEEQGPEDSAND